MNAQARKIWDALNPDCNVSSGDWYQFKFDTLQDKIFARMAEYFGHQVPDMPTPEACLAALNGSHLLVIHSGFKRLGVNELELDINGRKVLVLEIHPSQFAWIVGRATMALLETGAPPAEVFLRDARKYKRPVRA